MDWERAYKWRAHQEWQGVLNRNAYEAKLSQGKFLDIGSDAIRIESRTNLLFSFEKMAIRDALKPERGARAFAEGLYALLYGPGNVHAKFSRWCEVVAGLPRKQSRVLTWPVTTVFGFIAQPDTHIFLKPTVTRLAAREYGFDFPYRSGPSWGTYSSLLAFASEIGHDLRDLRPRDLIDIQSFIGSWDQMSTKSRQGLMKNLARPVRKGLRLFPESFQVEPRRRSRIGVKAILHDVE
jgi:hypothetical protein